MIRILDAYAQYTELFTSLCENAGLHYLLEACLYVVSSSQTALFRGMVPQWEGS